LTVSGWDAEAELQGPLQGVNLCETDNTTNCALSNDDGQVTIDLPIGETSYTLEKEGWGSHLVGRVMPPDGLPSEVFTMGSDQHYKQQHDRLDSPWPMRGTGAVLLSVAWAGATFELFDATGTAYYVHEYGEWRPWPDLTATTSRGGGGFVGVGPGDFQINLGGTAVGCVPAIGWPGVENSIRFPVREGYITVATVTCSVPPTVQLTMYVVEPVEGLGVILDGPRLEGAEVCQTETEPPNCVTTDVNGEARLVVPRDKEISYTATKEDYAPFLNGVVTERSKGQATFMLSDAQVEALADDLGIEYPLTGGIVALRVFPRMAGVTFAVDDETAVGYYVDEAGAVRLDLTATTSKGDGGFLEVPPGVYQIDFGGTATTCIPGRGWQGDAENQIKVPVKVGHITFGQMHACDEP